MCPTCALVGMVCDHWYKQFTSQRFFETGRIGHPYNKYVYSIFIGVFLWMCLRLCHVSHVCFIFLSESVDVLRTHRLSFRKRQISSNIDWTQVPVGSPQSEQADFVKPSNMANQLIGTKLICQNCRFDSWKILLSLSAPQRAIRISSKNPRVCLKSSPHNICLEMMSAKSKITCLYGWGVGSRLNLLYQDTVMNLVRCGFAWIPA